MLECSVSQTCWPINKTYIIIIIYSFGDDIPGMEGLGTGRHNLYFSSCQFCQHHLPSILRCPCLKELI